MMKHLQRAGEVIALYRRCLEVARLFPDPCGRNYLHYYVVEKFRKRSTETSPTIIGRHIKQGRNAVRRLRRSLHSRRDYQHVIELAYGRKGPFKHWHHQHLFEPLSEETTRMRDVIACSLPGSAIADRLLGWAVQKKLRRLFDYRHQQLYDRFGHAKPAFVTNG